MWQQTRNYGLESYVELDVWKFMKGVAITNQCRCILQLLIAQRQICKQ